MSATIMANTVLTRPNAEPSEIMPTRPRSACWKPKANPTSFFSDLSCTATMILEVYRRENVSVGKMEALSLGGVSHLAAKHSSASSSSSDRANRKSAERIAAAGGVSKRTSIE